jgi:hypothetical protein
MTIPPSSPGQRPRRGLKMTDKNPGRLCERSTGCTSETTTTMTIELLPRGAPHARDRPAGVIGSQSASHTAPFTSWILSEALWGVAANVTDRSGVSGRSRMPTRPGMASGPALYIRELKKAQMIVSHNGSSRPDWCNLMRQKQSAVESSPRIIAACT